MLLSNPGSAKQPCLNRQVVPAQDSRAKDNTRDLLLSGGCTDLTAVNDVG